MQHLFSDLFLFIEGLTPVLWPLGALFLALLASPHCLLMCGPICFLASNQSSLRSSLYHFGRLFSYLALGILFGWLGQILLKETQVGLLFFLATVFGGFFIFSGLWLLFAKKLAPTTKLTNMISAHILKHTIHKTIHLRSLLLGMVSGLLPCGLLYSFVILAAATKSYVFGGLFLFAFWLGTVPALSFATQFSQKLIFAARPSTQKKLRLLMASLFIVYGVTILYNRAQILNPNIDIQKTANIICGKVE